MEASIWCLLTSDTYEGAVLKAVNLGDDTDTTGAVTGGLGGLLYGFESIPKIWVASIRKQYKINKLTQSFLASSLFFNQSNLNLDFEIQYFFEMC